jgi:D-threonate/D-erythronate kinase
MAHQRILMLADDLTGALELGAKFVAAGVKSQVRTAPGLSPRDLQGASDAFVVDSETRHLDPVEAAQRIRQLAKVAYYEGFPLVYKKTDSTLRGNIGAELAAVIEAYAGLPLLYVPAYPRLGRTVRNGSLLVDGVLVGETSFALDPLNSVRESHIPTLLAAQCRLQLRSGSLADLADSAEEGIAICDGETDAELEAAARKYVSSPIFRLAAGPSGFATHLARLVDMPRCQPPSLPRVRNALIVNGSLHKVSAQQVAQAKREGIGVIDGNAIPAESPKNGWNILLPEAGMGKASLDFARHLAKSICRILARRSIDMLVVFGGDSAYAFVDAIGHPTLHPVGEVMEGIPISRIDARELDPYLGKRVHDLYLTTKAGGFGPPDVIASIRNSVGGW